MNDLVPIGRFSTMTRLSVKALRHYADIGLLVPAEVDGSSGYRYYRLVQANRAEAIRLLRSVDMSLDDIADVLDETEPENARKLLIAHRQHLLERLADQERMLSYLERLIEQEDILMPYDVTAKQVPDTHIVATKRRVTLDDVGEAIGQGFGAVAAAAGGPPAGAPFVVFHDVIDENTDGTVEMCFPVVGPMDLAGEVYATTLAATMVATTMHKGPYQEVSPAYHSITAWVTEHGHEFTGPPREIYLNDPTTVEPADYLTEVQWPIG